MRIDLHTHSLASDGTDTPGDLVRAARAAGLDVVGLTDHDTAQGWEEAARVAAEVGIGLVRGIEMSAKLRGVSVHLLAYLPDPADPGLVSELERVLGGRGGRIPGIVARLREHGVEITEADVLREAGSTMAAGRPHVADALVRLGHVGHRNEAFQRWLNPGGPAYVKRYAPEVDDVVPLVRAAGGAPVLAHPWGRGARREMTPDTVAHLRDLGLAGIEVDHQEHDAQAREELRGLARDLDLVITGSSDYHGTGKTGHDLGVNLTAPDQLERLLAIAAEGGTASGNEVPGFLPG